MGWAGSVLGSIERAMASGKPFALGGSMVDLKRGLQNALRSDPPQPLLSVRRGGLWVRGLGLAGGAAGGVAGFGLLFGVLGLRGGLGFGRLRGGFVGRRGGLFGRFRRGLRLGCGFRFVGRNPCLLAAMPRRLLLGVRRHGRNQRGAG